MFAATSIRLQKQRLRSKEPGIEPWGAWVFKGLQKEGANLGWERTQGEGVYPGSQRVRVCFKEGVFNCSTEVRSEGTRRRRRAVGARLQQARDGCKVRKWTWGRRTASFKTSALTARKELAVANGHNCAKSNDQNWTPNPGSDRHFYRCAKFLR